MMLWANMDARRRFACLAPLAMLTLALACDRDRAPRLTGPTEESVSPDATPPAVAAIPPGPEDVAPWFELATDCGVTFRHVSGDRGDKPFPAANGSGVALLDWDRDGRVDLYFASGRRFPLTDPDTARNEAFRAVGSMRFQDVTTLTGLGLAAYCSGVATGDYDNDGFEDIYVGCFGVNYWLHNLGDGTFETIPHAAADQWAASCALFDGDGDGWLDLYVCNYARWDYENRPYCGDREREVRLFCSPRSVTPEADAYYVNQRDGQFSDATATAIPGVKPGRGQGVVAADLDDDGDLDLYIGNDLNANYLLVNHGGVFQEQGELAGVAHSQMGESQAGMGVDAADVNGDGRLDLMVTNFQRENNAYYESLGDGLYAEKSAAIGLSAASLPWVGWGAAFEDFDLDGDFDFIVTNGHVDNNRRLIGQTTAYEQPGLVWRYREAAYELLGAAAGDYFTQPHPGRGLAVADLDNDGDADAVIAHQDQAPAVLRNLAGNRVATRPVPLRLVGRGSNRSCIGARVRWNTAGGETRVRQIQGGGSYLSARHRALVLGDPAPELRVEIRWPSGVRSELADLASGVRYIIVEPVAPTASPSVIRAHDPGNDF